MEPFSLKFVAQSTSGSLYGDENARVLSVSTDTRTIRPGSLFIALRGDRFDGHDYIALAFEKGAVAVVVDKEVAADGAVITVSSTARALLDLAAAYRGLFELPVCAVTGSVGKTSSREMIWSVLSQKYRTHKNTGNFNNEIGMPLSAFGLSREHGAAVFEMGMSGFGEISRLSKVAKPHAAVITNIGISHMEKLGSQRNILKAKLEILDGLDEDGVLILNGDDPLLREAAQEVGRRVTTYGVNTACDVTASQVQAEEGGMRFIIHENGMQTPAFVPAIGLHNVYNALAGYTAGRALGVSPAQAAQGIASFKTEGRRQLITRCRGTVFIEDCYNASPDSMRAAFYTLAAVKADGRRIAVLADMLELGGETKAAHLAVGKMAAQSASMLFAYGENARYYCEGFLKQRPQDAAGCRHFDSKEALTEALRGVIQDGDAVLFKASRGMKLEDVIDALKQPGE